MADHEKGVSRAAEAEERAAGNLDKVSGKSAAGTGDNPQDGKDSAESGAARPRGQTEDPQKTL